MGLLLESYRKLQHAPARVYYPVARWHEDKKLRKILKKGEVAVGAIAAAGHMPESFSDADINAAGYAKRTDIASNLAIEQLREARNTRLRASEKPERPLRFVDTPENIAAQRASIKRIITNRFEEAGENGKKKVLFSVCSVSAGFDINYMDEVVSLMDYSMNKYNGKNNVILSLFVPFNIDSVTSYSVDGQGLSQGEINGWKARLEAIQKLKQDPRYQNNIFIHEARRVPYYLGDRVRNLIGQSPDHEEMHRRGIRINGKPEGANTVYWDVNEMMVQQALDAVKQKQGPTKVKDIYVVVAEAGQESNSTLGGGPQILAELDHKNVPTGNMTNVTDGLTDVTDQAKDMRFLIGGFQGYRRKYALQLQANDHDWLYQQMWKKRLAA